MPTLNEGLRAIRTAKDLTNDKNGVVAHSMATALEAIIEAMMKQQRQIDTIQRRVRL